MVSLLMSEKKAPRRDTGSPLSRSVFSPEGSKCRPKSAVNACYSLTAGHRIGRHAVAKGLFLRTAKDTAESRSRHGTTLSLIRLRYALVNEMFHREVARPMGASPRVPSCLV